jgi:hypothetical protein
MNSGPDKMTVAVRMTNSEAGKMHSGSEPDGFMFCSTKQSGETIYFLILKL